MTEDETKKTILGVNHKYLRQKETGRVYPWHEELAKRDDVEAFIHTEKGDVPVEKPKKKNEFITE